MNTSKTSHNLLHTFCVRPAFRFQTQRDGEEVILVVRAHPITQIRWLVNAVLLLIFLLAVDYFFSMFLTPFQTLFAFIFSLAMVGAYIWLNILIWFFNLGIITNERVIDIDFSSVIYKEITDARLEKIQDITEKAGGFFESIFDYGDLFIVTASGGQNIEYGNIPHPSTVVKLIHGLTEKNSHKPI